MEQTLPGEKNLSLSNMTTIMASMANHTEQAVLEIIEGCKTAKYPDFVIGELEVHGLVNCIEGLVVSFGSSNASVDISFSLKAEGVVTELGFDFTYSMETLKPIGYKITGFGIKESRAFPEPPESFVFFSSSKNEDFLSCS